MSNENYKSFSYFFEKLNKDRIKDRNNKKKTIMESLENDPELAQEILLELRNGKIEQIKRNV